MKRRRRRRVTGLETIDGETANLDLEKRVRWTLLGTVSVLFVTPCAAAGLSAASVESRLVKEAAQCSAGGPRTTIERVDIVGAREHNRLRRDLGAKADGRTGEHYAMVVARQGKLISPMASFGPVEPALKAADLKRLSGLAYCAVDEN